MLTLELPNDAPTPVKFEPSIAGSVPVILAAGTFVKFAALIAGSVPVIFAAGILVKFAALIAGKFPVKLPAGRLVKFAPLPECPPTNVVAVTIPVVTLLTIKSAAVPSARNKLISPPDPVILFIPDILSVSYTHLTLPTKA